MNEAERFARQNYQTAREEVILSDKQQCENYPNKFNTSMIDENHWENIFQGTKYEFFNYEFMKWLACSLQGSFTLPNNVVRLANIENVRETISVLTRVGAESVSGTVFDPKFEDATAGILIKTPKNLGADLELFHEFFVGTYLNTLRSSIPNFMFVFGLFRCDVPKPDIIPARQQTRAQPSKTSTNFCRRINGQDIRNYLLIEKIGTGLSMDDAIEEEMRRGGRYRIFSWIVQVASALHTAYHEHDFTHHDLHLGNVLIRPVLDIIPGNPPYVYIPYFYEGLGFRVKSQSIATLIDYGRSHIKDRLGNHYGNHLWTHVDPDLDPSKSNPLADLYRFIGWIVNVAVYLVNHRDPITSASYWYKLIKFFEINAFLKTSNEDDDSMSDSSDYDVIPLPQISDEDVKEFIDDEKKDYFTIGQRWQEKQTKEGKDVLFLEFLDFLQDNYPKEWDAVVTTVGFDDVPELNCARLDCVFP